MAFREVRVFEVREVLRLWLAGDGIRATERLVGFDRKTVRRSGGLSGVRWVWHVPWMCHRPAPGCRRRAAKPQVRLGRDGAGDENRTRL